MKVEMENTLIFLNSLDGKRNKCLLTLLIKLRKGQKDEVIDSYHLVEKWYYLKPWMWQCQLIL